MSPLSAQTYCITVREKAGEAGALGALTRPIAARVLTHIVAKPKAESQSDSALVKERVGNVLRSVGKAPCVWDSKFLVFNKTDSDDDAAHLGFLLSKFREFGAAVIPAIHRRFDFFRKKTFLSHARSSKLPICVIVDFSQIGNWGALIADVADMGAAPEECVVKIEISDADLSQHHEFAEFLRDRLIELTNTAPWSRIIVSGTSYPLKNLAPENGAHRVTRHEWLVWRELCAMLDVRALGIMFEDYGADHSRIDYKPGGRTIQHLRWTQVSETVIVRGGAAFESIHDVARRVRALFDNHDSTFCQGDAFLESCAKKVAPGNATTWRTANMNRHITLLALQTAKILGIDLHDFRIEKPVQLELFVYAPAKVS